MLFRSSKAPTLTLGSNLYKYDLKSGARVTHDFGKVNHLGEPIFVPRQGARAEDDGFVLALAHDEAADQSRLIILDAQNFDAAPIAEVTMPQRVPYGAHGNWMAGL